ncbi:hypothetical protein A5678_09870 [Mycobacterium sp. E2733]|nr:hypothetical protein A5678_09870 [Mycobacterium sp. E2733]
MQQRFEHLQVGVCSLIGVQEGVDQTPLPHGLAQAGPRGRRTLRIDEKPLRAEVPQAFHHAHSALEDTLVRIHPGVEHGRDRVSHLLAQVLNELAADKLLGFDDQAVADLHHDFDSLLERPGFAAQLVQHGIDVLGDLQDFVDRVTFDNQHHVMDGIGQRSQPVQQIPDMVLGLIHLVGEAVYLVGQALALVAHLSQTITDLGQSLIDLAALRNVLTVE